MHTTVFTRKFQKVIFNVFYFTFYDLKITCQDVLTLLPLKPPKVGIAYLVKFAQGDFVIFK